MGAKINRGFIFYLFLLLGILLGAFLVCVVIMIFVPEFSLFGMRCFNENIEERVINMSVYENAESTEKINSVQLSDSSYVIEKIEINSNINSVNVFKSNALQGVNYSQFVVVLSSKRFGFTTQEVSKSSLSVNYFVDTKTLKINAIGPEGFLDFGGGGSLSLQIPPAYSNNNISLKIDAKNEAITIGDSYSSPSNTHPTMLYLKSINLKTNGPINVTNYASIGSFSKEDCSIIAGNNSVNVDTIISAENLLIKSGEATLHFNEDGASFNLTGNLTMETDNSFVHLGIINATDINLKNSYGKIYFTKDVTGNILINKDSKKCDYEFKNITGRFVSGSYLDEIMIDGGYILVDGTITGEVAIASTGNIKINKILSATNIKNISGNIIIEEIEAATNIKSVDGSITLGENKNQNDEFISCGINARVSLETTGNGQINAYFKSFQYAEDIQSNITTKNCAINIYLIQDMPRNISAVTTASLKYLGTEIESKSETWTVGTAKTLNINSNANVTISVK